MRAALLCPGVLQNRTWPKHQPLTVPTADSLRHRDRRSRAKSICGATNWHPNHNDFAHAVGLSNGHKRSGHPHTANASASDFADFTGLKLGGHFATLRPCHNRVCRDIDVRELKVGYSSSRSRLLTGPASCLSNISIACGRLIVRLHRTCHSNKRHVLHIAGPSPCHLDTACQRCRFRVPRWGQIKSGFSRGLRPAQLRSRSQVQRRETGVWQRRFWEHVIRDDADFERHVDYIHFNPVKHQHVARVCDWPYSSFHRYVNDGLLPADSGGHVAEIQGRFGE